jgi:hypothetical protein
MTIDKTPTFDVVVQVKDGDRYVVKNVRAPSVDEVEAEALRRFANLIREIRQLVGLPTDVPDAVVLKGEVTVVSVHDQADNLCDDCRRKGGEA